MSLSVGELVRILCGSLGADVRLTAGKDEVNAPVLRLTPVDRRQGAENVRGYDAVLLRSRQGERLPFQELAEAVKARGAVLLVVCREQLFPYGLERLRGLSERLSLPLVEAAGGDTMYLLTNRLHTVLAEEQVSGVRLKTALCCVAADSALFGNYRAVLEEYGFFEQSVYCAAVYDFIPRGACPVDPEMLSYAAKCIEIGAARCASAAAAVEMGSQTALVISDTGSPDADSAITSGLSAIPRDVSALFDIRVGVSGKGNGIGALSRLLASASRTAVLQRVFGTDGKPVRFSEQGLGGCVMVLSDSESLHSEAGQAVGRLREYDRLNHTAYLDLLKAYLRCNASLQKTADALYIHKNTVSYSLRRIESILGCRLTDLSTKAELMLMLGLSELSGSHTLFRMNAFR